MDRVGVTGRFFASAMTMTGNQDTEDASYLELAEFIANRDDHLRNHGFMRTPSGFA